MPRAPEKEVKSDASSFIGSYRLAALMAGLAIVRHNSSSPEDLKKEAMGIREYLRQVICLRYRLKSWTGSYMY